MDGWEGVEVLGVVKGGGDVKCQKMRKRKMSLCAPPVERCDISDKIRP